MTNRRRRWTDEEDARLRRMHGCVLTAEIAQVLFRSMKSVYQRLALKGLARRRASFGAEFETFLKLKHAAGWSNAEIAHAWSCGRHAVGRHRCRLGLPTNALSAHRRQRVTTKTRAQVQRAGCKSLADIRAKVFRKRALAAGWPEDLRPRAVQILNVLWERGPMTRRELAEAIGLPWRGARSSLKSNDSGGSHLAELQRRGLAVRLGRIVRGRGRGNSVNMYSLPVGIQRGVVDEQEQ